MMVCLGFSTLPLAVIGRLCCVIMAVPGVIIKAG